MIDDPFMAAAWRYADDLTEAHYADLDADRADPEDVGHVEHRIAARDRENDHRPAGTESLGFDMDGETEAVWAAPDGRRVRVRWNPYSNVGGYRHGRYIAEEED
jgi:hypothetical protein